MKSIYSALMLGVAFACAMPGSAFAQQDVHSGNFVKKVCETDALACYAYITGAMGGMQIQALMDEKKIHYCRPEGVTTEQIRQIFLKRLRDHPEENHYSAAQSLYLSLRIAFPCQ